MHVRNQLINKITVSSFNKTLYIVKSSTSLYIIKTALITILERLCCSWEIVP